jgi:hypothetical protein
MKEFEYNGKIIKKGLTMYDIRHTFAREIQNIENFDDHTVVTLEGNEDVKAIIITLENCLVTEIMIVKRKKDE